MAATRRTRRHANLLVAFPDERMNEAPARSSIHRRRGRFCAGGGAMRSTALTILGFFAALALAGCCTSETPAPAGPSYAAPAPMYHYYGAHPVPMEEGGGWCWIDGPHVHPYP